MSELKTQSDPQTQVPQGDKRDGRVFISYSRDDRATAHMFKIALQRFHFDVWLDESIRCGDVWSQTLENELEKARCVVVLWSRKSMQSRWVMHEASVAIARRIYAPVAIDSFKIDDIAAPYNRRLATPIVDWDGEVDHARFCDLLQRVNELVPMPRSWLERARTWTFANVTSILAVSFAVLALAILSWQTLAVRLQIAQMDTVVGQQIASAARLDDVASKQEESTRRFDEFQSQFQVSFVDQLTQLAKLETQANATLTAAEAHQLSLKNAQDQLSKTLGDLSRIKNSVQYQIEVDFDYRKLTAILDRYESVVEAAGNQARLLVSFDHTRANFLVGAHVYVSAIKRLNADLASEEVQHFLSCRHISRRIALPIDQAEGYALDVGKRIPSNSANIEKDDIAGFLIKVAENERDFMLARHEIEEQFRKSYQPPKTE